VDVQGDNIDESVAYFKQLMDLPEIKSIDPTRILVLIHKMDPEIRDLPDFRAKVEEIKKLFNAIKKSTFFETSIYDYWSVINSFSQGLKRITMIRDVFNKLLKEFARATFSSAVLLLEENLLVLEKHGSNEDNIETAQAALKKILDCWVEDAVKQETCKSISNVTDFETDIDTEDGGKAYFQKFSFEHGTYFITAYSKNPKTEMLVIKKLPKLAHRVHELTRGFFI
jgi:hypothetical protein